MHFFKRFKWYKILQTKKIIRGLDKRMKKASDKEKHFLELKKNNLKAYVEALKSTPKKL